MTALGSLAFLQPWFLLGLLALPILYWLLRVSPPTPRREKFPGVRMLLGLDDPERTPHRTPWWLLLLRLLAVAFLISAFAEPLLNPKPRLSGQGPVLLVMDGGWASAPDWVDRRTEALDLLAQAGEADRPVAFVNLSDPTAPDGETLSFAAADAVAEQVAALEPLPWRPSAERIDAIAAQVAAADSLETIWIRDAFDVPGAGALEITALEKGPVRIFAGESAPLALTPPEVSQGALVATVHRPGGGPAREVRVRVLGPTDDGVERPYGTYDAQLDADATEAEVLIDLPLELRNRVTRMQIAGETHAGAVAMIDDRARRRTVALVSGERRQDDQPLLSGLYYLRAALEPSAAFREMHLEQALGGVGRGEAERASWADVIVLSDVGRLDDELQDALVAWVENGGLLIRFAGPQLAALATERGALRGGRGARDPLLPTELRGGGRALDGALSWSEPQTLRTFPDHSPFAGLEAPDEVTIRTQVLAEPSPELSKKTWAALDDGTPLVTGYSLGSGQVALFHVSAEPTWSTLPLSGLFVGMLERLVSVAPALAARQSALAQDAALWAPTSLVDGYGGVAAAGGDDAPVAGSDLAEGVRPGLFPGVYAASAADETPMRLAVNAAAEAPAPRAAAADGVATGWLGAAAEVGLKPWLLAAALILFLVDLIASSLLLGRRRRMTVAAGIVALVALGAASGFGAGAAHAQTQTPSETEAEAFADDRVDPAEQRAANETVLAYVLTGDASVDRVSEAGLRGLSSQLFRRTSIEPTSPAAIDLERDELAVYAILYWPITASQPELSDDAIRRLNGFLRTGGLLILDTRDAHQTFAGREGPMARHLRRLAGPLDLPALGPAPADHVLMRSFYLLDELPGRWAGGRVWVEAVRRDPTADPSVPQNANDGVSPVIVGGADWAAAWAVDKDGRPLFAMGRGGERQREIAYRFGVNAAMYAFTGNYKSDQVHIPALLERLGN